MLSMAALVGSVITGRDQYTLEEMVPTLRSKLAQYLMEAISEGSEDAMILTLRLTEMGTFDEVDEAPRSDGLHGGDVPG